MSTGTSDLRRFGLAFGGGLTVLGSLLAWKSKAAAPWVLGAAGTIFVAGLLAPRLLAPLEKVMAAIFRAVTVTLTYVLLTIIFVVVLTPMGLVRRLLGRDSLGLKLEPDRESYWVDVEADGPGSRPESPF